MNYDSDLVIKKNTPENIVLNEKEEQDTQIDQYESDIMDFVKTLREEEAEILESDIYVPRRKDRRAKRQGGKLNALQKIISGSHRLVWLGLLELSNKEFHIFRELARQAVNKDTSHPIFKHLKVDLRMFHRSKHFNALQEIADCRSPYDIAELVEEDTNLSGGSFLNTLRSLAKNTQLIVSLIK
jgi:hypothetical protein